MKIFMTGASSGIGLATYKRLKDQHEVVAFNSRDLDLANFEHISMLDLSAFDCVINCAGSNHGTYLGWHDNSWANQVKQIDVNYSAVLLLAKQYTSQRKSGQFVYVSSASIDAPSVYNIFTASSKAATQYAMNVLKKHYTDFVFTEICPGKTKTNMLKQNYQGAKSDEEIELEYNQQATLSSDQVAEVIVTAIEQRLDKITILPH